MIRQTRDLVANKLKGSMVSESRAMRDWDWSKEDDPEADRKRHSFLDFTTPPHSSQASRFRASFMGICSKRKAG